MVMFPPKDYTTRDSGKRSPDYESRWNQKAPLKDSETPFDFNECEELR